MNVIDKLIAGVRAFRESYVTAKLDESESWDDWNARRVRYALQWASYCNDTYRVVHKNASAYKTTYALYKSIRSLRNPTYCIAEFQKSHIWGGPLSRDAGPTGAIPIYSDDPRLNECIADIWKWSQWQTNKDLTTLYGATLGDVGIRVVDAVDRVYLNVLSPDIIRDVDLDAYGNVRGYVLQEKRNHPENENLEVTYTEEVVRDGELVVFRTYLNNDLYAWPGNEDRKGNVVAEWSEPYGFVPLVMVKHSDLGFEFGFAETHVAQSRIRELDDLTSMLSDQIRKTINTPWLFTGIKQNSSLSFGETAATTSSPEPWREEHRAIYTTNDNAKAQALVAPLDIENVITHIDAIYGSLEADYPELRLNQVSPDTQISGRALRLARQPLEGRLLERRAVYDSKLEAALKMAIAIGGHRGIYTGFDLGSYQKGDLDFKIAERPVFESDPEDEVLAEKALWESAEKAVALGISLRSYLSDRGYSEEQLDKLFTPTQAV